MTSNHELVVTGRTEGPWMRVRKDVSDRDALEEVIFRDFQHAKISTILMLNKYEFQRSI